MGSLTVSVEQLGGANQSRPFGYSGGKIVVLLQDIKNMVLN